MCKSLFVCVCVLRIYIKKVIGLQIDKKYIFDL